AHVIREQPCGLAAIEPVAAVMRNALQRAPEVRLPEQLALAVWRSIPGELLHARGIWCHAVEQACERTGQAGRNGEAVARERDAGLDQRLPLAAAVSLVRECEAGDRAGYADREVVAVVDVVAVLAQ